MIGKLLDHRYQVVRVLAVGGFGQTYIAQDTRRPGNPICVVKHLKPTSSDPKIFETAKRLFNSEAETLERLGHHDQIPRLLAYFDENQEFYLVQEYIEGHTITEELIPGKRWNETQVMQFLQDALSILEFVHQQGVIHRDIKPDNIIRRTSDHKLVLVDFGAVKQLRTSMVTVGGQPTATVAIGTPGYMPTEQGQGKPRPNSDIYSLGIIAIQALTGLPAAELQEDPNTGEIIWLHLVKVNSRLAEVLTKMVRYHFKDRYQTATEALQACKDAANPLPVAVSAKAEKSINSSHYQPTTLPSQITRQKTVAVAPANPIKPQPSPPKSPKSDPWPLLIGLFLAGGAAAVVANVYPNVKNFASNFLGNDATTANKCLAVVAGNSNIRSEPSSINSDNVLQTIGENSKFEVTGRRTKRGWVEIKFNSRRLAWAHSDVIINNQEWTACLRNKGIAIQTFTDNQFIASKPVPQPKEKSPEIITPSASLEPIISATPTPAKSQEDPAKIIAKARQKYDSGDLLGAIATLRSVPDSASAGIKETTAMIQQWQQDWEKADALFKDINQALDDGQWDKVLDYQKHPEKLPNIKYWRDKLEPVFKQAAENLEKQVTSHTKNQDSENHSQPETSESEQSTDSDDSNIISPEKLPQNGY
ncbi:serine/threonine protein kinase [Nostoc sp. CMAA1605]|uniref:serine/threonine protein kinase n=1 Tax=Nostoc sp. CMAA1605 TaxID=2055159 RepID=UPI001F3BD0E0|nr:serine/threonine protein kinase [Nostoc sp. CMAA1605]MCF4968743.1 serine/threonine protein kinase [Nostoc sp. CMAA1605]